MSDEALQLVTFRLADEEFGIDIKKVHEINRMIDITRIPNAPPYVEGVVNLRGKIIPIVSLRTKLGLEKTDHDKATRIMVVEIEGSVLGFIVDSVSEVLRIQDAKVEPAPSITGMADSNYLEGVINLKDRILILLNLTALFASDSKGLRQAA
ncbi:MAG: chemotaxis protein CheW [Syntrophorhabdales bacterium]|jgi:purine-binding chemotaxis protein CheW